MCLIPVQGKLKRLFTAMRKKEPAKAHLIFYTFARVRTLAGVFAIALFLLAPCRVYAEPHVSHGYLPLLWLVVLLGTLISGSVPFIIKKLIKRKFDRWVYWVSSIVLGLAFLIFAGPTIMILGSILITGRTM